MPIYISAAQAISPQETFLKEDFPAQLTEHEGALRQQSPSFKQYFSRLESRRINTLIKSGHVCALEAVAEAEIEKPDAIITASGLGCVASTEKFLNDMLRTDEGLLAPTAFIQSTSNAVGGQVALHYKCEGYNVLYAQKSHSFENALLDGFLRLKDGLEENILVGGFDEITDENVGLKQKVGLYKADLSEKRFVGSNSSGSIPGEGVAFFVLTNKISPNAKVELMDVSFSIKQFEENELHNWTTDFLQKNELATSDVDLVLCGYNGDEASEKVYDHFSEELFGTSSLAYYKHFCGEYDTSASFALWFGVKALATQNIPEYALLKDAGREIKHVLIYDRDESGYNSLVLLKAI